MSFWCHRLDQNMQQQKYCKDFCPESFCNFLGASWKLFGVPVGFLISMILCTSSGNPKNATKNFRTEILTIFLWLLWSKRWNQKDISKLTDLYKCLRDIWKVPKPVESVEPGEPLDADNKDVDSETDECEEEAIRLAIKFNFVCDLTSMVIVEDDQYVTKGPLGKEEQNGGTVYWPAKIQTKEQQKSSWPVAGLQNRGPLKDLNDFRLIVCESKWFPWSSRINFIPFRIFRGPLFHKPVTGQELCFAVPYR